MTIKEKMLKIMSLALEINPPKIENSGQKKTAVSVNWSPHCSLFEINIYYGCWKRSENPDKRICLYTDKKDAHAKLNKIIKLLEKIKEELSE